MIFSELYSAYYDAVAAILREVLAGNNDPRAFREIVRRYAFSESVLTVLPALEKGEWQLLYPGGGTPVSHTPTMPLSTLERRFLSAVARDPRIRLFPVDMSGFCDASPLFTKDDYCIYDQYADGDDYEDPEYIERFRTILRAIREKQPLSVGMRTGHGRHIRLVVRPLTLEYSGKDDKFRLIAATRHARRTLNVGRIDRCEPFHGTLPDDSDIAESPRRTVTLRITDEHNAMERCMLHFAHFEKQAEKIDDTTYLLRIRYDPGDETEMVIRVLSFGPRVYVTEPPAFVDLIKERLQKQFDCGLR